ncbi:hypothetical protein Q6332_28685, partial [Klebsiella pneumoniae]|nr:hypothetical protein [Klebsiella pneumoniae]
VTIGEFSSIAHRSIVHGPCTVGDRVFIGFNSVLFNCAVGDGCVVRTRAQQQLLADVAEFHLGLMAPEQFIPNRKEPLPKGRLWQCGKAVDTA